jgi:hypothetical protein
MMLERTDTMSISETMDLPPQQYDEHFRKLRNDCINKWLTYERDTRFIEEMMRIRQKYTPRKKQA